MFNIFYKLSLRFQPYELLVEVVDEIEQKLAIGEANPTELLHLSWFRQELLRRAATYPIFDPVLNSEDQGDIIPEEAKF